jgi:hypothetical protein
MHFISTLQASHFAENKRDKATIIQLQDSKVRGEGAFYSTQFVHLTALRGAAKPQ